MRIVALHKNAEHDVDLAATGDEFGRTVHHPPNQERAQFVARQAPDFPSSWHPVTLFRAPRQRKVLARHSKTFFVYAHDKAF
jgi:hypothetical protein